MPFVRAYIIKARGICVRLVSNGCAAQPSREATSRGFGFFSASLPGINRIARPSPEQSGRNPARFLTPLPSPCGFYQGWKCHSSLKIFSLISQVPVNYKFTDVLRSLSTGIIPLSWHRPFSVLIWTNWVKVVCCNYSAFRVQVFMIAWVWSVRKGWTEYI